MKFLKCKHPYTEYNEQILNLIPQIKPKSAISVLYFNFALNIDSFQSENRYQLFNIDVLSFNSPNNIVYIYINESFSSNENFSLLINKIISSFESCLKNLKIKVLN